MTSCWTASAAAEWMTNGATVCDCALRCFHIDTPASTCGESWNANSSKRTKRQGLKSRLAENSMKACKRPIYNDEWLQLTSRSTHNRSFRRRVFPGNQLHWYTDKEKNAKQWKTKYNVPVYNNHWHKSILAKSTPRNWWWLLTRGWLPTESIRQAWIIKLAIKLQIIAATTRRAWQSQTWGRPAPQVQVQNTISGRRNSSRRNGRSHEKV